MAFSLPQSQALLDINVAAAAAATTSSPTSASLSADGLSFRTIVGLEVHVQLNTETKLFSAARTAFGAPPNTQVSAYDAAYPGELPVLNRRAVDACISLGIALSADVHSRSHFDRKHYFYPDLPSGYQITQQTHPLVSGGKITFRVQSHEDRVAKRPAKVKTVHLEQLRLEQDSGKSLLDHHPSLRFVDLNRAGVPLIEVVSLPELESAQEAAGYVRELQTLVQYLGISDGSMDEGSLRCDVNVNLECTDQRSGSSFRTEISEVKNLNSIRHIIYAIDYEVERQMELARRGEVGRRETRSFDPAARTTALLRSKESEVDYRYMPDPDLPTLVVDETHIDQVRQSLPELPAQRETRFREQYGLAEHEASLLVGQLHLANYFETLWDLVSHKSTLTSPPPLSVNASRLAHWVSSEVVGRLAKERLTFGENPLRVEELADLLILLERGSLSALNARTIADQIILQGDRRSVIQIAKEDSLLLIQDKEQLAAFCRQAIEANPDNVRKYHSGKHQQQIKFFIGQVMKESKGNVDPRMIPAVLTEVLDTEYESK
eukprot:CAMPEP_0174244650 /NCGR_PEP_ID=MMETSP0417-20130205/36052_1 /TAXON_ID=242541 /ORGANISM="Mayorella sp, Strain BSH-02190019" /LENGTH=547 /DNA_ID=CAMNT_0015324357 /DNA_START=105 /DNA_END=1749 /DNA_ORIENTATION=+